MSPARFPRSALILAAVAAVAAVAAAAGAVGCGSTHQVPGGPGPAVVYVAHHASNGKTVRIRVGDRIAVILTSTYWKIGGSSAPAVVRQSGRVKYLAAPHSCPPGVGCGSVRAFFTAVAPGMTVITAHRESCGEVLRCTGSRGRFRLTVIVR